MLFRKINNSNLSQQDLEIKNLSNLSKTSKYRVSMFELINTKIGSKIGSIRNSIVSYSKQNYEINRCTLINLTILSACGTFFVGYNEAVFDTMEEHLHRDFLEQNWSKELLDVLLIFITTGLTIGAIFGAVLCGMMTNRYGRKNSLLFFDILAFIGTGFTIIKDPIYIIIGRLINGFCLGGFTTASRLFMVEIAPIQLKARCIAITEFLEMFAILLAYLLGLGFNNNYIANSEYWWRIMFGVNFLTCGYHFFVTLFCYNFDTPIYIYVKESNEEKTKAVLKKIYKHDSDINQIYKEIVHIGEEKIEQNKISFYDVFKNKRYRIRTLMSFMIVAGSVFVGSDALIFYSNSIFLTYTDSQTSTIYTNIVGMSQFVASLIAISFVEHMNRRSLFLVGYVGMLLLLILSAITVFFEFYPPLFYLMVGLISYNVISVGPCTHLYISEILPEKGLALSYGIFYVSKVILTVTYKPIQTSLTLGGLFSIYAGFTSIVLIVIYVMVKETNGKTLTQIENLY